MKSHFPVKSWMTRALLCGIALSVVAFSARADQWDKRTILTIDQPIQVVNTLLEPGRYVFKLADSNSNRNIVQIFNSDETHIVNTILAIPNYRLQPTDDSRFMFWETPPGSVRALRAWFYPGDNFGQEFRYPRQLALARTSTTVVTPTPAPPPPVVAAPPEETPAPPPAPQTEVQKPPQEEPPVIAQNNPPPLPPPPPEAQPAPPPPVELPKTATPYPLIGLGGLLSLGLYGLLQVRRLT